MLSLSASWAFGAAGAAAAPPEGRGYELVTPPNLGTHVFAVIGYTNPGRPQTLNAVAADGTHVAWSVRVALPGVDSLGGTDTYVSQRDASGWSSAYVSPPGSGTHGANFMWASPDLDHLIWQTYWSTIDPTDNDPVVDPTKPYNASLYPDLYQRDPNGRFTRITKGSQAPPVTNERNSVVGASPDGQTVVFNDSRALEPGATSGATTGGNVYERRGNTTTLVSVDENGAPIGGVSGSASSDDGGVVVFGAGAGSDLYVRDRGLTRTVRLPGSPGLQFESLSADGRKVFFLSESPLTGDDTDGSLDLFEYDTATGTITRLSKPNGAGGPGPGNTDACSTPLPNAIFGSCAVAAVAVSRDGAKAYFVSPEQLDGTKGTDGGVNLYFAQGGTVRFVATLDPSDQDFGIIPGSYGGSPQARDVRLTPDGSKLLFESRAQVTGYDNAGHTEIYVYNSADGSLVCASCRPDGTPPTGDASLRDGTGGSRVQFSVEPMYPANSDEHGDRIFFQSTDTIVPHDLNRRYDVYEHIIATGATELISSGTSENDSVYLGNGVDGKDVFFFTTDTLDPRDRNGGLFKLYDAREGGGFPPPAPIPAPCIADGCRAPGAPPPAVSPSGTGLTSTDSPGRRGAEGQFAARAKVSVSGVRSVKGATARLSVKVSGPGRLRASGSGVLGTALTAQREGTYRMTLRLSQRARATLRRSGRLNTTVTFRFMPSEGSSRSARVKMTFISTSKKGRA